MRPSNIDDRAERPVADLPAEEAQPTIISLKRPGFAPIKLGDLGLTAEERETLAIGAEMPFSETSLEAGHQQGLETDPALPNPETN